MSSEIAIVSKNICNSANNITFPLPVLPTEEVVISSVVASQVLKDCTHRRLRVHQRQYGTRDRVEPEDQSVVRVKRR